MDAFAFKPVATPEPARWVVEGLHGFGERVTSVVPAGFEAYARVFHPAYQVTRDARTPMRWSEVALRTGRTVHKQMHWPGVRGEEAVIHDDTKVGPADKWFESPEEGTLPADVAKALSHLLRSHTRTPDECFFGIWEGFGCLDRVVHRAPSFEIPGRRLHLFRAPIEAIEESFCSLTGEGQGMGPLLLVQPGTEPPTPAQIEEARRSLKLPVFYQSANLWWPAERAWCVATEIDFVSTYVGGSAEAIGSLLKHPRLECLQIEPEDELRDRLNPKPLS